MKRKRLDRDRNTGGWGFEGHPYYQMRVDIEEFHGLVCLIQLTSGKYCYWWDLPIARKTAVCGKGMTWLQLVPDGKNHVLTAKYLPESNISKVFRHLCKLFNPTAKYPLKNKISVWYADVIENIEYDTDGVAVFVDKYLDVIFTPQGDMKIDDRNELDEAFQSGEMSRKQYESALKECDLIIEEYCSGIEKIAETEVVCSKILFYVEDRIAKGERQFKIKHM